MVETEVGEGENKHQARQSRPRYWRTLHRVALQLRPTLATNLAAAIKMQSEPRAVAAGRDFTADMASMAGVANGSKAWRM